MGAQEAMAVRLKVDMVDHPEDMVDLLQVLLAGFKAALQGLPQVLQGDMAVRWAAHKASTRAMGVAVADMVVEVEATGRKFAF
eukprot:gene19870-23770_t